MNFRKISILIALLLSVILNGCSSNQEQPKQEQTNDKQEQQEKEISNQENEEVGKSVEKTQKSENNKKINKTENADSKSKKEKTTQISKEKVFKAAKNGDEEILEKYIDNGGNVNVKDTMGISALIWASKKGHKEIAELLIENGADVDITDSRGKTPLMLASRKGYKEIVELLIENGADVNITDRIGKTALIESSIGGNKQVAKLLIENGADVNIRDDSHSGMTALMYASRVGNKKIVKLLVKNGADIGVKYNDGDTILMRADREVVDFLIENGADIDNLERKLRNAVIASKSREISDIQRKLGTFLVDYEENTENVLPINGLHSIKYKGEVISYQGAFDRDYIQTLKEKGVDLVREEIKTPKGNPYIISVGKNQKKFNIGILVKKNKSFENMVKGSYQSGEKEIGDNNFSLPSLIYKGGLEKGNYKISNTKLQNVMQFNGFVKDEGKENLIYNMPENRQDKRLIFWEAASRGYLKVIEKYINNGIDVDVKNENGMTALIEASKKGYKEIAELLIENGAEVDLKADNGKTAFDFAKEQGNQKLIQLLKKHGAK